MFDFFFCASESAKKWFRPGIIELLRHEPESCNSIALSKLADLPNTTSCES